MKTKDLSLYHSTCVRKTALHLIYSRRGLTYLLLFILSYTCTAIDLDEDLSISVDQAPLITEMELNSLAFNDLFYKYYEHFGQENNCSLILKQLEIKLDTSNNYDVARINLLRALSINQYEASREYLHRAIEYGKKAGEKTLLYSCYYNLSAYSEVKEAIQYLLEAQQIAKDLKDQVRTVEANILMASLYIELNLYGKADLLLKDIDLYFQDASHVFNNSNAYLIFLLTYSSLKTNLEEYEAAKILIGKGERLSTSLDNTDMRMNFSVNRGVLLVRQNDYISGVKTLQSASKHFNNDVSYKANILLHLVRGYLGLNSYPQAKEELDKLLIIQKSHPHLCSRSTQKALVDMLNFLSNNNPDKEKLIFVSNELEKVEQSMSRKIIDDTELAVSLAESHNKLQTPTYQHNNIVYISLFAVVTLACYFLLFYNEKKTALGSVEIITSKEKESKGLKNSDHEQSLLDRLNEMEKESKFCDSNLSLEGLSVQLNTNRTYLSHVINKHKGQSFTNYVNSNRIKSLKNKITKHNFLYHYSIEGLALECGFNNAKTFNRAFYKFEGISCKEYIEKEYCKLNTKQI